MSSSSSASSSNRPTKISQKRRIFDKSRFFQAILANNVRTLETQSFCQADLNSVDVYGWSGLMMAASAGSLDCVRFLLANNADTTIKDRSHHNALSLAQKSNHLAIVELIEMHETKRHELLGEDVISIADDSDVSVEVEDNPFFCEACQKTFYETTPEQHRLSIVHKLIDRSDHVLAKRYHISDSNIGFQLILKQGWNRELGLGPAHNVGMSFPVKTTIRKSRSGLGTKQEPARITHFNAFDNAAIQGRRPSPIRQRIDTKRDILRKARRDKFNEKRLRRELS